MINHNGRECIVKTTRTRPTEATPAPSTATGQVAAARDMAEDVAEAAGPGEVVAETEEGEESRTEDTSQKGSALAMIRGARHRTTRKGLAVFAMTRSWLGTTVRQCFTKSNDT